WCAALRTGFRNGLVPQDEITVRILQAPVEDFSSFGAAFDEFAATTGFRTCDTNRFRFDVFALRIVAAGSEFAEAAFLDGEFRLAAFRTGFVKNDIGFLRRFRPCGDFASRLAFRITRAGQELSESTALQRHRLAAVLARLGFAFG